MAATSLSQDLKNESSRLGFDLVGICPATTPPGIDRFRQWLNSGYDGQMQYLSDRATAYEHPKHVLHDVRSIVILGMNYHTGGGEKPNTGTGLVSCYAWGSLDYHELIRDRLNRLKEYLRSRVPSAAARGVVDTAPLLEREFAQLAGLGWIGKNTLLINRKVGSWFFLAALLTDIELEYDRPHHADHCGTCRACLDACPTDAFPQPYVLDATRCISYLTIEHRGSSDPALREKIGDWVFGCDICQSVCPWNRHAPVSPEPAFQPEETQNPMDLCQLFSLDETAFRAKFRHTPLWRSKRQGLLRNAAIALGNQRWSGALSTLAGGLNDHAPLVRAACAWALGQYSEPSARQSLLDRLGTETDAEVRVEISNSLENKAESHVFDGE